MSSHHYPVESDVPGESKFSCALNHDLDIFCQHDHTVKSTFVWVSQVVLPKALLPLRLTLCNVSLFLHVSLSVLTLSPHLAPSSTPPDSLLLCSPQSPPKGATIPYRPKPASTPVIFSGGQVRADPLGASTANLSLLLQHQPLPVSVAPGFTHSSSLPLPTSHLLPTSMTPPLLFTVYPRPPFR